MKKESFKILASFILIVLFTYTSINKIMDYHRFVFQMRLSPLIVIKSFAGFLGWVIPLIEGGIVILLLVDKTRILGFYASSCLLILFEVYVAGMLLSGLGLPCTCGGFISKMSWRVHLPFNALFILLSVWAIVFPGKSNLKPKPKSDSDKNQSFSRA